MARGTIPLALPLIRWREVGQFYFGDRSTKWVTIQPALTAHREAFRCTHEHGYE